jgi:N-acetylated-alpha-linked acidic dipeptidase
LQRIREVERNVITTKAVTVAVAAGLLLAGNGGAQQALAPAPYEGFSHQASAQESGWEAKFRAELKPENIRENMQRLSARPHHVGSPYDKDNAEWMAAKFREWGFDTQIETFYVLFPTPKERVLELIAPTHFTAKLQEPPVAGDPTSDQQSEQLPSYNAYSRDGDVTAPLVYVNYGRREDFDELERYGVQVKGAIVIARYGAAWRGIKPKVAAERGAIGCIIYSDPQQDGYAEGDTFPHGPARPPDGVQRGSVADTFFPGDPLTPGVPATKDAKRLRIEDSPEITKIPVLPISYADAQPLLAALSGPLVPPKWRGGLPVTYHLGPGPAKVHLKVKFNWDIKEIHDVLAKIPGTTEADQWVIRGNHHDAWVNGAKDPVSGISSELEEARALGVLLKQGWKPRRTMIYCAWDGEEPGLLGSTEWVEMHAAELRDHAVLYLNSDETGRGIFAAEGAHSVEHFINTIARGVTGPETKMNILQRARLEHIASADNQHDRDEERTRADMRIDALGDGSDYSPFLDFVGIPSLDIRFEGEDHGGSYHSIYDDFYWYTHFSDKTFVYGRALAETSGTAMMRMADAELLPYEFGDVADTMHVYVDELEKLTKDARAQIEESHKELKEGAYLAASDPQEPEGPPKQEATPPFLNFAPLENGAIAMTASAEQYKKALTAIESDDAALDSPAMAEVNHLLMLTERATLRESGLPGRPWYKNQIYAPGAYTGYGVKTLAAVHEAIDQHDWTTAEQQSPVVGSVLQDWARGISVAAAKLQQASAAK